MTVEPASNSRRTRLTSAKLKDAKLSLQSAPGAVV